MRTLNQFLKISILVLALFSCSPNGFKTGNEGSSNENSQGGGNNNPPAYLEPIPASVELSGFISSGQFSKLQTVDIDRIQKLLLLRLPLGPNPYILSIQGVIPEYPDIQFSTEQDTAGLSYLTLKVPLKYVLRGVTDVNPAKLPNGDALPSIPAGELPRLAFTINTQNNVKLYVYLGVDVVGLYVESPWDPTVKISSAILNKDKTATIGWFHMLPAKSGYQGGFFLSFILPGSLAVVLDKYIFE